MRTGTTTIGSHKDYQIILIDTISEGWVHRDFNDSIIQSLQCYDRVFIMAKQEGLGDGVKNVEKISKRQLIWIKLRAPRTKIVFLTLTRSNLFFLFLVCWMGQVSYLIHKYNLVTFKSGGAAAFVYKMLRILGVTAWHLDQKPNQFVESSEYPHNIFRHLISGRKTPLKGRYKRVLLIGEPSKEKNLEGLSKFLDEENLTCLNLSDELDQSIFPVVKFADYIPMCGDVIWGGIDVISYDGVKSGLPYAALKFGLPIAVTSTIGFKQFHQIFPEYLEFIDEKFR